jgi:predicted phosphodiesterase
MTAESRTPERTLVQHPRPVGRAIAQRRIDALGDPNELPSAARHSAHLRRTTDRVAVISDVHANAHALRAVLSDIQRAGIDRIWCLGDTVGYGAHPIECLRMIGESCEIVLAGNHDLAAVGDEPIDRFGEHSRPGVVHARVELELADDGPVLREWLALRLTEVVDARRSVDLDLTHEPRLAHHLVDEAVDMIAAAHGAPSPFDAVWDYVGHDVSTSELGAQLAGTRMLLVGHSHLQSSDECGDLLVVNPGSVGQPRDGDPRAAWAELDPARDAVELHRTSYDVDAAAAAIVRAGLPQFSAERLRAGQ